MTLIRREQWAKGIAQGLAGAAAVALLLRARAELEATEVRHERAQAEVERLRAELKRREAELVRRRELIERLHRGRRAERDWNQELRAQLQRAHAERRATRMSRAIRTS